MALIKSLVALVGLSIVSFAAVGCAADTNEDTDGDVAAEGDEITAAGRALIGSYKDDSGSFRTLVLTAEAVGQANKFSADVDTGIRCVRAPCPSAEHIEGTFTAGSKTITLKSTTASQHSKHLLGTYNYLVQGSKLSLIRKNFSQSLAKEGCAGLPDASACSANPACQPKFGPSACSPDGRICTADMAYKGCFDKNPPAVACMSSASCAGDEFCTTEIGVCNSTGMLAVCSGTCAKGARKQQ